MFLFPELIFERNYYTGRP